VKHTALSDFDRGVIVGLLMTQGSFGGDGRTPHITLKMHVRHEPLLRWLHERFPRTKLYGPYEHGQRRFFQWTARGAALVEDVLPVLEGALDLDPYAAERLAEMRANYAEAIGRLAASTHPMTEDRAQ
jgi:hypothetical protein